MASLLDRMKRAVSGELEGAIRDTFSSATLRDSLAAGVNAATESFRQKASAKLAATPEVDRVGARIGAARVKQFLSSWGVYILGGAVVLWLVFRRRGK